MGEHHAYWDEGTFRLYERWLAGKSPLPPGEVDGDDVIGVLAWFNRFTEFHTAAYRGTWMCYLPIAVSFVYGMVGQAARYGLDLARVMGEEGIGGSLDAPLRASAADPGVWFPDMFRDGVRRGQPETVGQTLSFLMDMGLVIDREGQLTHGTPVPDITRVLRIDPIEAARLEAGRSARQVRDTLRELTELTDTPTFRQQDRTLRELGDLAGLSVDEAREGLASVLDQEQQLAGAHWVRHVLGPDENFKFRNL